MINVVICIDKTLQDKIWNCYNSVMRNTKSEVQFYIFCQKDVDGDLTYKYADMGMIVKNLIHNDLQIKLNDSFVKSPAMYLRFLIPQIIKEDKVIYLEADSVYDSDIQEHWSINIGDNYIGAVKDWFWENCKQIQLYSGYIEGYDNTPAYLTGNMIINCKAWREDNITEKLVAIVDENNIRVNLAMSIICRDKIKELGYEWCWPSNFKDGNICRDPKLEYMDINKAKIYHWSGKNKPWNTKCLNQEIWDKYNV